jgi:hypothetical protein
MPVLNSDIARGLDKLADLLELEGANPFRIRAYRNAARVVGELPRAITVMTAAGKELAELPGSAKTSQRRSRSLPQPATSPFSTRSSGGPRQDCWPYSTSQA